MSTEKIIVAKAQELRQEALDRLNADLLDDSHDIDDCYHASEDITIRSEEGLWWLLGFMFLGAVAITNQILIYSSSMYLQFAVSSLLFPLSAACLALAFLRPVEIYFCKNSRKMTVIYRAGWLFKKPRTYEFYELESIKSTFVVTGDNDPSVSLELMLNDRERLRLKTAPPDWSPISPLFGFSGCLEPKEIEALRKQIAALTGTKDLGFFR